MPRMRAPRVSMRPEPIKHVQNEQFVQPRRRALVRVEEQSGQLRRREHSMPCDQPNERPVPIGQMTSERPAKLVSGPAGGGLTGG